MDVLVCIQSPNVAPRWPTFARSAQNESLCHCARLRTNAKQRDVGAGAKLAGLRIGTSWQFRGNSGPGGDHASNDSLFALSDFYKPMITKHLAKEN